MTRRRTRKWEFVKQEATRLAALGLTAAEIGRRLDINKSTVTRWFHAGKLAKGDAPAPEPVSARPRQSPEEWAAAVRADYDLDATDDQLVTIGEQALALSLNAGVSAQVRMTAAGRFQAIVRQLALVARRATEQPPATEASAPAADTTPKKNPAVRRPAGDPRLLLVASR